MTTLTIKRLDEQALRTLARDIVEGTVFCTNDPSAIRDSFALPLAFLDCDPSDLEQVGALYEEVAKSGTRGINGHPFFTSFRFLHKDDLEPLDDAIAEFADHRNQFIEGKP